MRERGRSGSPDTRDKVNLGGRVSEGPTESVQGRQRTLHAGKPATASAVREHKGTGKGRRTAHKALQTMTAG